MSTDDYLTINNSSNRSHLGAKSSNFQAKIRSHTSYVFMVTLIKNTECTGRGPKDDMGVYPEKLHSAS